MLPKEIVKQMIENDAFSKWLGLEILELSQGFCKLKMLVRKEMTNGFSIAHGGISYSLADSALAFAANSEGTHSLSIETSISHTKKVNSGDCLIATTQKIKNDSKTSSYNIIIENQNNTQVALFKGIVFHTSKKWEKQRL